MGGSGPNDILGEPAPRRGRTLVITLFVLGILLLLLMLVTGFYTDWAWYKSVGATNVFSTSLFARIGLLVVFGLLMATFIGVNMWIAYRVRPAHTLMSPEQASLERYRMALDPVRRVAMIAIPGVLGLLAGVSATAEWEDWLLFRNATPFGVSDPQFGQDVSFYVFTMPFLRFVVGFLFSALVLSFLVSVVVHYVYGGLRLQPAGDRVSRAAMTHLSILVGLFVLLKAGSYWLDRYDVTLSTDDYVPGVTYKDVNALIPGLMILVFISVICAILFFAAAVRPGVSLAVTGLALLVIASLAVGSLYPAFVESVQVKPTEFVRETPYIQNNINATRAAFGLDAAQVTQYAASDTTNAAEVKASQGTITNIRLLDPTVVSPTYKALQAIRNFYAFPESLDVDRYPLNGQQRGAVVAVRELNLAGIGDSQRNWANDHIVYTHGFGMVAAYDNTSVAGQPSFFESDLPSTGLLDVGQPRIYFGENSPAYSIVGGPTDGPQRELDYPDDKSPNGQATYTYQGTGGVPIGSFFNRAMFALKYQEPNMVLSDLLNTDSRILEIRDPRDRVEKVAPWLTTDGDPYPIAVDGRVVWMVDGYTSTDSYPNSTPTSLGDATTDTLTQLSNNAAVKANKDVNYIRNSVKATVDAYDGTVTIYQWDTKDPILQTWMKAFPGVVQPRASMPTGVVDHVRYPEDLFKVQRQVFAKYHVTDPAAFFSGQDFWNVPNDPTKPTASSAQPPYYLQVAMPGMKDPAFSLTTTFAPQRRQTLAAFMAVNSEPGPNYGKLAVLQLPSNTTIPGPSQVQNNFESDPTVSQQLSLVRRGGSDVQLGNLLSLPVAGGVLYVEPVYIRASNTEGFPILQKVLAGYGSKVSFQNTLGQALSDVFGTSTTTGGGTGTGGGDGGTGGGGTTLTAEQQLISATAAANLAYSDGKAALAKGDFAAYGEAQKRLEKALADISAAEKAITSPGSTASPTPTPTPSSSVTAAPA